MKSGRGGQALLSGLLSCAQCGHRLQVAYAGRTPQPVYRCHSMDDVPRCVSFSGKAIDAAVGKELLRAVTPLAIEAAEQAEQMRIDAVTQQRRIVELELNQARYEVTLAERRYMACDPDNRNIAAQLEKNWEAALCRVQVSQARLEAVAAPEAVSVACDLTGLAADLEAAWNTPGVTMRSRQRLVRALVVDIVADVDKAANEVVLVIHWHGGQHSQLRIRKPKSGRCTSDDAIAVIRSMAVRWSDQDIAATLNRMGMRTADLQTWTAERVRTARRKRGILGCRSVDPNGEWFTMSEAAKHLPARISTVGGNLMRGFTVVLFVPFNHWHQSV